jgi:polysaccharide pyruvyl transferase WcaK-like protein
MAIGESRKRIGIFLPCGQQNLGDEAIFAAVIQNVHSRLPSAEIIGFTINPADSEMRHGLRCFPIRDFGKSKSSLVSPSQSSDSLSKLNRFCKSIPGLKHLVSGVRRSADAAAAILREPRFLFKSYRRLKGVELLLVAGSQQLNDVYGGVWGFPYNLLKWTLLSKCTGTKIAILSVGAGPINSSISKFFFRCVLDWVDYRSYRDAFSSHLVKSMGSKGIHPVFPDLVYSLQFCAPVQSQSNARRVVVGINPVPFYDNFYWYSSDPVRYEDYVCKFASFSEWLDKSRNQVLFFPTQLRADVLTIRDIRQAMNGAGNSENLLSCSPIHGFKDLISEISRTDLVVANRYHGILISLALGKPVIGLAYHEKSRALLEQVGLGEYVLNSAEFEVEELIAKFRSLEANAPAIRKQIAEHMAPLRRALDEQYGNVFALIDAASTRRASMGKTD